MSNTAVTHHPHTPMPPEPWGRRLSRAREDVADLTLDEATALAAQWTLTTKSTIARLETKNLVAPTGPRSAGRRALAYVLCLCYGVDPAEFDLSPDDLPSGIDIPPRSRDEHGNVVSTKWSSQTAATERKAA